MEYLWLPAGISTIKGSSYHRFAASRSASGGESEVLWALATHFQPADDLFVVDGLPGSPLDPSSSVEGTTSRLALDATRGPDFSGVRIGFSDESLDRAERLISDLPSL